MRLLKLFKPSAIKKGVRYLRLLGPRLLIHAIMEKLRGRTLFFYNEERLIQDSENSDMPGKSTIRVSTPLEPKDFRVSIIIPSDNFENIKQCIENLADNTTYPNYEIVIVTKSEIAEQLEKFRNPKSEIRIHIFDKPFNFSEKCNEGALTATGNVLCFYNDDIYPLDSDWIEHMLQALRLPNIGGVNPLLMSDNKIVLTAGIVLSSPGLQTFAFQGARYTPPRHLKPNRFIMRDVSVLSGACLLIKKEIFEEVGKFNAENTPNSFSDTEISLKIRNCGYRCVITPNTRLLHENKISWRKTDKPDKAFLYMLEKWGKHFASDVFFTDAMKTMYRIAPPPHIYKYYAPTNIAPRKPKGRDILFYSHELSLSGAPIVLMDMVKIVQENGDWPVVASLIDGPLRQKYLDMGVIVTIDNSICDMTEKSAFIFDYVARNFDIVVVNTLACGRVIDVLSDSLPPVIWWIHESPLSLPHFWHILPEKTTANTKVYTDSKYSANTLSQAGLSYNYGRLAYGVEDYAQDYTAGYASDIEQKNCQESALFITIGSIDFRKGQDILMDALKHIDKDIMIKAEFVLIGADNDSEIYDICLRAREKYGNISIHGSMPREHLQKWYKKADCLILPSREDPLPVVANEAMMFSTPVICSDQTGTAEFVNHHENGLIFPSEDCQALAEYITYAIENRDNMAKMGRRARKEIYEEHFTIEKFKNKALQTIEEAITEVRN